MSISLAKVRGTVVVGLWLALSPADAAAQEPPPGFVRYVLDELNRGSLDIEDPTSRSIQLTETPPGVLLPVDVSRDGVADWLIQWPEEPRFCGTGGCRLSLYVSEGEHFLRVFDRQAWDPEIRTIGDEVRLEASFHHLNCLSAREVCRLAWSWDPVTRSLSERPSADGEAVISGFGEATVDLGDSEGRPVLPSSVPAAVLDRHLAGRRACGPPDEPEEFTVSYPAVASTPDLNGDGGRDWVIEAPSACEGQSPPAYGYEVWVTNGTEEAVRAFVSEPGRWPRFRVDRTPAQLIDGPASLPDAVCETITLEWDVAAGAFRPASSESTPSQP